MIRARALFGPFLPALALAAAVTGCGSSTPAASHAGAAASAGAISAPGGHTRTGVLRDSPAPLPAGTPPAPAGLARTAGYSTYELCRGHCAGAVPQALRRSLHLPAGGGGTCPATSAPTGDVSVAGVGPEAAQRFIGSRWLATRVTWRAAPGYRGPVLIRGRRLGGPGSVGFGEGHRPYDELQLMSSGRGAPVRAAGGGRAWLTLTRVRTPGCYAYQVDGSSFSTVIVFRVRA